MTKIRKKIINKRAMILMLVFMLVFNVLAGCGKKEKVGDKLKKMLEESCSTEDNDESRESMVESEAQLMESTETQTEVENIEENSTEMANSGQTSSLNNASNGNENNVGLGKESYKYITSGTSSNTAKEEELGKEIVKKIIKKGMGDFEKVKAINDYMIKNIRYDMDNYKNNTIPEISYTALGALEKKVAVCSGYARTFKILAKCAGLEATYVVGDTPQGGHAWNQVKVDGKWYNIDVTWNDGDYEIHEKGHYACSCYKYFLLSNEDFNKSHRPEGKVNNTGSSRDFEAYMKGCPYDVAVQYCTTQEDFDKMIKEMIAANITTMRAMSKRRNVEELVLNALKKQGIYGDCKVNIKDAVYVSRTTYESLEKYTIEICLNAGSYAEAKKQKVSSIAEAKKVLENAFKHFDKSNHGVYANIELYLNAELLNDMNFIAELRRYAQYEKKMSIYIRKGNNQVADGLYKLEVEFKPLNDDKVFEIITNPNDLEAAIKRMFQYGYKGISFEIRPNGYKLTGNSNEAERAFVNKYCQSLIEKYCLTTDSCYADVENNIVYIEFSVKGHDVKNQVWEIAKEATCVSDGLEVKICNICNKAGEERVIPKNDNHSYYWDTNENENIRVRKCKLCSYVGLTEYCYGGVWGYFDEAAAQEKLRQINSQRERTSHLVYDDWGKVIDLYYSPVLTVSKELTEYAKERLRVLNSSDFATAVTDEYAYRYVPQYSNTSKKVERNKTQGLYSEVYDKVGIICFMYDVNGDASRFLESYVMEFGLAE